MAFNLKVIIEGIDKVSGAFKAAGRGLDDLEGKAKKVHDRLKPLNSLLGTGFKVATGVAVAGIVALGAGLVSSVQAAAEMEQGIADISAAMGASADETTKLKKLITDLGLDPKLKVTATEAAEAIGVLGTAGVAVDDILNGVGRSTVLLANATGATFADAAAIASDAMALWNIEASDMKKVVDGVTSTTIASKFTVDDYRLALAQAGGVAATVGVEFDDFNATIAAISPFFASGSDAGTSFKTMLQRLVPDSKPAREAMTELGLITADGANQFFTASGEMKSMGEIAGILNQALGGLSEEQKNQALSTIFGTDAMRAAAAMAGMTEAQFQALKATMAKTDAEEQAKTRMDTLRGSLEILTGVFDTLKMGIGEKFLPVFQHLVDKFTAYLQNAGPGIIAWAGNMADKLGQLIDKYLPVFLAKVDQWIADGPKLVMQFTNAATQVGAFLAQVIAVIGPVVRWITESGHLKTILLAVAGVMAVSAIASVVSFVASIVGAVSAVVSFVGALTGLAPLLATVAAAFAPVIAIVAVVAAAVAGLYLAWQHNFLGIRDKTREVLDFLKGLFTDFPGTMAAFRDALGQKAREAMDWLRNGFVNARDHVRNGWDQVMDTLQRAKDERLNPFMDSLRERGQQAMNRLREGLLSMQGGIQSAMDQVGDWLNRGRDGRLPPFQQSMYDAGHRAVQRLSDGLGSVREAAKNQIQQVLTDVQNHGHAYAVGAFAGRLYEGARSAAQRLGEGLNAGAPNFRGDMERILSSARDGFNATMNDFSNHFFAVAREVVQRIRDGFGDVDLAGGMSQALDSIINVFNGVMDGFKTHVWDVMRGVGRDVINGLREGIINAIDGLRDALNYVTSVMPQWIKDKLGIGSPSKVFEDLARWIPAGLAEGIMQSANQPLASLTDLLGQMTAIPQQALADNGMTTNNGPTYNNNRNNTFNISLPTTGTPGRTDDQVYGLMNQLTSLYA